MRSKGRLQTLQEQKLGTKAVRAVYCKKGWSLNAVEEICRCVDKWR